MNKKLKLFCSLLLALSMIAPLAVMPVFAADGDPVKYTEPQTPSVTYNMNLDWHFYDTKTTGVDLWQAIDSANNNGKRFYETDYVEDPAKWSTVSIPHGIGGGTNSFTGANYDSGGGYRSVILYRKEFTVPQITGGAKIFFELEGIRQAAYVWINGQKVGYYEAGIAPMGFDITKYVTPGEKAVIAICNDGTTNRGTTQRYIHETKPGETRQQELESAIANTQAALDSKKDDGSNLYSGGDRRDLEARLSSYTELLASLSEEDKNETWGTSFGDANDHTHAGSGIHYVWNTKDFNEPMIGLVYDAYLHVKGSVYQTLPLYNNLKTQGNYIYADNFDIRSNKATIHVDAEVRNETDTNGSYTLEVDVVDDEGNVKWHFASQPKTVEKASEKNKVYETAVESDVYDEENLTQYNGITKVNTTDVTHIEASYEADDVRFWSTTDPYLYTVYTTLVDSAGNPVDVQKKTTGFRKITYDENSGILINDKAVWMPGYAQRSTNEWAVIGVATDWLQDYDMELLKENNSNFIRWMHVAPKPNEVRSSDKYGVAVVVPAGDKEGTGLSGRAWSQRMEAMRDVMIYFRNSPSVVFWETGNSAVATAANANEMASMRDKLDPKGMRFIGARSTTAGDQLNYDYNYAGTMCAADKQDKEPLGAIANMRSNDKLGPIMETEYSRNESPRRVWDLYSPPDYDYVNKYISKGGKKDNYDVYNQTQEQIVISNITDYYKYYSNRAGKGRSVYSAAAMMVWSDSNMHTRNTATENDRTTGRVDAVRQTKEMFEATKTAQSPTSDVHIVGHWSYPKKTSDNYWYYDTETVTIDSTHNYERYLKDDAHKHQRDVEHKTVYVIGSSDVSYVKLFVVEDGVESEIGTDKEADSGFIYSFVTDVTKGDAVIARAYDARDTKIAEDKIERNGAAVGLRLTPHMATKLNDEGNPEGEWRADGADIAYIDVEVVDSKGNVCALNYDKIEFEIEGEKYGTYLGGYNSGVGTDTFQTKTESEGLSHYFGGIKTENGYSIMGEKYVYAENGTNRIFVRSTREAGDFKLTARMDGVTGPNGESVTLKSTSVDKYITGGLSTQMSAELSPGVGEAPIVSNVPPLKPLMLAKKKLEWKNAKVVVEEDTTVYYDVYLNGTKLEDLPTRTYIGTDNTLFGPVYPILQKALAAGASGFTVSYDDSVNPEVLLITTGQNTYEYETNRNSVLVDGTLLTECVDAPVINDSVMVANLQLVLEETGINYTRDNENKIIYITTAN